MKFGAVTSIGHIYSRPTVKISNFLKIQDVGGRSDEYYKNRATV